MNKLTLIVTALLLLIFSGCQKDPTGIGAIRFDWSSAAPESRNMSPQLLDSALTQAQLFGFVDGFLVIRNGYIVAEKYYNGYHADKPHNIKSVSKSFLSAITGIALHQGHIDSMGMRMLDYFPEYIYPGIDARKYDITVGHLLTMRMGIRGESEEDYLVYHNLYISDNWVKNTIEEPLVFDPGQRMRYNTFQTHLLSAIITKATSVSTREYARKHLFEPMKIDIDDWEQDPQGYYFGGNSMYFTPREMAVLGYLYLHNGCLNDEQIVPAHWVDLTLSPSTDNTHPNQWGELKNYNYGYLWWLGQIGGYDMFMGYGYGGQFVVVFPDLDLIVVSTARHEVDPDTSNTQEWAIFEIIADYVVAAVLD